MAHFPARTRRQFPVKVQLHIRHSESCRPVGLACGPDIAEEIRHGSGAEHFRTSQREIADGTELLLKLAGDAGVNGEVAGVVGPGREFVDEQPVVSGEEELDAEDAGDVELFEKAPGNFLRPGGDGGRERRGGNRDIKDSGDMGVRTGSVEGTMAILRPDGDDGKFGFEIDQSFQHRFLPTHGGPPSFGFFEGGDAVLALAVIAETGRFQDGGTEIEPGG